MFANWLILDRLPSTIRKGEKPTVELATMWHRKFFQVKGMIRPLTYGVWAFWPMKWLLERRLFII
jgi:hypothetical protein